jgi:DNA adenine methylase
MKYMGSKNRLAKHLLPIMLHGRTDETWIEPFVGGANMIDKVQGERIGSDLDAYLIEALKLIKNNVQSIPDIITEDYYAELKEAKELNGITGFCGYAMSFGGKWFGGYRRDVAGTKGCIENMKTQTRRSKANAVKQSVSLGGVELYHSAYQDLDIPYRSIIYCDPPYEGTTKYKNGLDYSKFWEWCRQMTKEGHLVFISEYNAPEDFDCIWLKSQLTTLSKSANIQAVEKLFIFNDKDTIPAHIADRYKDIIDNARLL